MNEAAKQFEEKEGCPLATLPSPLCIGHMHTTQDHPSLQAHLDEFFARIASSPELQDQLSPEDLPQLLEAGLSHVLNTVLKTERQLHLESHPQDRANGYAPKPTLQVGATRQQ